MHNSITFRDSLKTILFTLTADCFLKKQRKKNWSNLEPFRM
jgi:hypothetical protein